MSRKLQFAVVCSSNQNRSMEAHALLQRKGFNVRSYGTGTQVKLPGPAADKPNIYEFGVPYQFIHEDLKSKNPELYRQNGLLSLLERNMRIKPAPERWQDQTNIFDVIVCFEERVYEAVLEDFAQRGSTLMQPAHVFSMNVRDNAEDATVGAAHCLKLATMLESTPDWEDHIDDIADEFQAQTGRAIIHSTQFY